MGGFWERVRLLERVGWLDSKRVTRFWEGGFWVSWAARKFQRAEAGRGWLEVFEEER